MSFTKAYITQRGVQLCVKILAGETLEITAVLGGDGQNNSEDYTEQEELIHPIIEFECPRGIQYEADKPRNVTIPIYFQNTELQEAIYLSEIGVFAKDPDQGEILLCILPAYDAALALPAISEGRLELTMDIMLELSLAPEVSIVLPPSLVFLTRPEADLLYAKKEHRHAADKIDESIGMTTEAWQREQDAEIEALKLKTDAGTTMAETHQKGSKPETNWKILNNWGIYDQEKNLYYA